MFCVLASVNEAHASSDEADVNQTHRSRNRSSCECDAKGWICTAVVFTEPYFTLLIVKPIHS